MRYVVKLWKAWTGWKYAWKFSKFNFLQCFRPKEWEKVVVDVIFSVWEDSTIVWVSLVNTYYESSIKSTFTFNLLSPEGQRKIPPPLERMGCKYFVDKANFSNFWWFSKLKPQTLPNKIIFWGCVHGFYILTYTIYSSLQKNIKFWRHKWSHILRERTRFLHLHIQASLEFRGFDIRGFEYSRFISSVVLVLHFIIYSTWND